MSVSEEQDQSQVPSRLKKAQEQAITPHKSIWPITLAVAIFVLLVGTVTHPVVFAIGAVLAIVAVIGWGVERR